MLLAAGQTTRRDPQPRVGQQRGRQQTPLEPGILLGLDLGDAQLPLGFGGPPALDRVPDHAVQHVPGHLALDQVILGSRPHRLLAQVLARIAGQHDDGRFRLDAQQLPQPLQALRVRQAQVEQHARGIGHQGRGLAQRPGSLHDDRGVHVPQQFLDEQGVAVVVLHEQDGHLLGVGLGGRGLKLSVTCHGDLPRVAAVSASEYPKCCRHTIMHARRFRRRPMGPRRDVAGRQMF